MADKHPQSTLVLIKRLRRAAKGLRSRSCSLTPEFNAWANTCDQAAGRLVDLLNGTPIRADTERELDEEAD